jgi:TAT (twin-arginine translocation) pathway signal sequence
MKQSKKEAVADRRSFLKLAGAGAAAGGAALMTGERKAQADEAKPKTGLYRETEHIRRYYELAR